MIKQKEKEWFVNLIKIEISKLIKNGYSDFSRCSCKHCENRMIKVTTLENLIKIVLEGKK